MTAHRQWFRLVLASGEIRNAFVTPQAAPGERGCGLILVSIEGTPLHHDRTYACDPRVAIALQCGWCNLSVAEIRGPNELLTSEAIEADRIKLIRDPQHYLEWRDVQTPCERCKGTGKRVYGSTSVWRGGAGGCAMTTDVCDRCWGSGDANHPWTNLREREASEKKRIEERAADLFARRLGARINTLRPAMEAIALELDRLSRGRKERPYHFADSCEMLAKLLRALAAREPQEAKGERVDAKEGA